MRIAKLLQLLLIGSLAFFFSACTSALPLAVDYKTTNYEGLMAETVAKMSSKISQLQKQREVVLVTDFVNVDKLQNKSRLGFLLSSSLKDTLSSKYDLTIREASLSKNFKMSQEGGLKLLSRNQREIDDNIYMENYAIVGTYTLTSRQLIVFVKIIDIYTGHVLGSASNRTRTTSEVIEMDKSEEEQRRGVYSPIVL